MSALLKNLFVLSVLVVGPLVSTGVHAHAIAIETTPMANAEIIGTRLSIDLKFNSRIDIGRSRLAVFDAKHLSQTLAINPNAAPNRIQATATDLTPGDHLLEWYVLSTDGHITRGRLKFKVRAQP